MDHACGGNPYPHPVIQVVSSTLHIEKQWSGDGDKPESITVDIKQGGDSYKTVTLKSDDDSGKLVHGRDHSGRRRERRTR